MARVRVIYLDQSELYIYCTPKQIQVLGVGQEFDGCDLHPGFRRALLILFEDDTE